MESGPEINPLVICLSHSWGGLEQVAANDSLDLSENGIPIRVLCLRASPIHENLSKYDRRLSRPGITSGSLEVLPLDFKPRNNFDFKFRTEIENLIDSGVNLVHTHQTSLLGSIIPWLWKRPEIAAVATRHIMNDHNKKDFFHRAIYSRLDSLIVMSQTLKENVLATHPLRENRVRVINLGLDFDRFDPDRVNAASQRALWGADADTTVIGLVGRIDPAKGQATFIKAAAGLLKKNLELPEAQPTGYYKKRPKLKFVVVGEETLGSTAQHLEELKQMIAQFRIEEHVVFAGYQENIPEVMRAFDIFVMPSRQEAFGLVAIEAMAMECPIIISSGGSSAEIVGREEFGLTVRPEDAFDLQRQIRYFLENPEIRKAMGERAREHVKKNYDRQVRVQKTLRLYEWATRRRDRAVN